MWKWCKAHGQTITGYAGVVFGVLELNVDSIKEFIPQHYRGLPPLVLGMAVAIIGHASVRRGDGPPPEG